MYFKIYMDFAIQSNKGDPKAMAKAVSVSLRHCCSTTLQPQHDDCSAGAASWFSFQREHVTGTITHKPVKDSTPSCIQTLMTPIFDKLGSE